MALYNEREKPVTVQPGNHEGDKIKMLREKISFLAQCLQDKRHEDFSKTLIEIKRLDPENPNAIHLEGLFALQVESDVEKAHRLVSQAAEILPESPAIMHNLATIKITRGNFPEAERLLLLAVHTKPDYAEAFHTLAGVRRFKAGDPIIERMEVLAKSQKFSDIDASFLCFALAKAYDEVGQYQDAWSILMQGNALMKETYPYESYAMGLKDLKKIFTKKYLKERSDFGHPAKAPIFIVGMPRSGTTLLEKVLGENPLIKNAGELPALHSLGRRTSRIYSDGATTIGHAALSQKIPNDHLFRWGEAYLTYAQGRVNSWSEYFTDKLPDNIFNIGFASLLLPNSKFIHIRRNPMDITLSIFLQRFTNLGYGFKIRTIVDHYRHQQQAMAHWNKVISKDRMAEVHYEDLVDNKGEISNHIHKKFNIDTPKGNVPDRQETQSVSTASRWQARQPIYATSKQKWEKYRPQLLATEAAELLEE